jgi:transposase
MQMIVIGVDTHKRSHTIVALDAVTGAARGQLTISASDEGTLDALRFAAALDEERVWAVEDCRHVSGRLERGLVAHGDRVVRVAPGLTESSRRAVRTAGKSDPIDATAIARAALREGIDTLPVAFLDEQAHEIRVLSDYRDQLINERVRLVNRLRWHLVQIAPELEAQIRPAGLIGPQIRAKVTRGIARLPRSPQARVAKLIHKRICDIHREETELLAELKALIETHCPALLDEHGCGTVTAAIIIGHTAGAKRFPTDACFARHAGTAPIPASSGNTTRHRLHRGGDRQLNRALHIIALSRARTDPPPAPTSTADTPRARPKRKRSAASSATSPAASGECSTAPLPPKIRRPKPLATLAEALRTAHTAPISPRSRPNPVEAPQSRPPIRPARFPAAHQDSCRASAEIPQIATLA